MTEPTDFVRTVAIAGGKLTITLTTDLFEVDRTAVSDDNVPSGVAFDVVTFKDTSGTFYVCRQRHGVGPNPDDRDAWHINETKDPKTAALWHQDFAS